MYVLSGVYLDYSPYFYNPGTRECLYLSSEYGISYYPMNTRVNLQSEQYDAMLPTWGDMNVYLDPINKTAYFMPSGWHPSGLPSQEDIYQPNLSSLWNVEDGQYIMTSGVVMAKCSRGFILAMGYSMENSVLVYDSEWRYDFPVGYLADVYIQKTTYRGLPELIVDSSTWMYSWYRRNMSYYWDFVDLTAPSDFASYSAEKYECVRYTGTLVQEGSKYYVYVDGIDGRRGEIFFPIQDLSAYVGKKVTVEGYFLGFTGQGDLCTMMTSVYIDAESDGVTEDFFLGDDIQM